MYGLDRIAKNSSFSRPDRIQIWRQKFPPVGHFLSDFAEIWTQSRVMLYIQYDNILKSMNPNVMAIENEQSENSHFLN